MGKEGKQSSEIEVMPTYVLAANSRLLQILAKETPMNMKPRLVPKKKVMKRSSKGTENPVSGSSQFPILRRSSRLIAKSATDMLAMLERTRPKPDVDRFQTTHCDDMDDDELAILIRRERQLAAKQFRLDYTYGSSTLVDGCNKNAGHTKEKKTCIWSCGTCSWWCKSSGIMWVAVHGMDSICVVTRDEKLDETRVGGLLRCTSEMEVLHLFRETVISEIEDLADPPSGLNQLFDIDQSIRKPFGVVSTIPDSNKVHEECSHEAPSSADHDEEKAIEFLQEKMKSGSAFTFDETVQTAILAFQQLFHKKLKAKEIRVCAWKEDDAWELPRRDIREHLAAISSHRTK